jgi:ribose transport system substrate-binding protein
MKKRIITFVLVVFMMVFAITGCSTPAPAQSSEAPSASSEAPAVSSEAPVASSEAPADTEKTIGVVIWGTTGAAALQELDLLTRASKITGVKIDVLASGYNADAQLKDIENFAAKGVDGIMICNCSEEVVAKLADICEENKIYFGQFHRNLTKQEIKDRVYGSKYFVGNTCEDEEGTSYILGKTIAEMGIKNVAITTGPHGDSTAEGRYAGLKKAFDEKGVKILGEQWDVSTGETAASAAQNFISSNKDLELIATMFSVEAIKAANTAINNAGKKGKVKLAAQDTTGDAEFDLQLLTSGEAIMAGGHLVDPIFTYMMLCNAINGTPLSDKPIECRLTQIVFTPERAQIYFKQMEQGNTLLGYGDEDFKKMFKKTNPDITVDALVKMATDWSVEDFLARNKK